LFFFSNFASETYIGTCARVFGQCPDGRKYVARLPFAYELGNVGPIYRAAADSTRLWRLFHGNSDMNKKKDRRIEISVPMVTEAMQSKERLEGFAFAVFIKLRFVDSYLKGSIRDQKKALRIGQNVLQRAKCAAIKYGYVRVEDDGRIFALPVKSKYSEYRVAYDFGGDEKRNVIRCGKLEKALGEQTQFSDVVFFLREFVVRNRVRQQNAYSDLVREVTCGSRAHRAKARRKLRSMWKKAGRADHTPYNNLSFAKMQAISNSSLYTVHNVVNTMVADGTMRRKACNIPVEKVFRGADIRPVVRKRGESGVEFRRRMAYHYANMNTMFREAGGTGYIHQWRGRVFVRMADMYRDTSCTIKKKGSYCAIPE